MYDKTHFLLFTDDLVAKLQETHPHVVESQLGKCEPSNEKSHQMIHRCGRTVVLSQEQLIDDCAIFYIGAESLTLTNIMYSFPRCQFYSYNPETLEARKENVNVNKMLMKRYYLIEKAKDAQIVGILVGTLGVANYLEILNRLKKLIKRAGKKSYVFIVGKINVAKLANFMEIDVFVLIACAENSLLDSSEFYRPVVTPYEMELACNSSREWTGEYPTDFASLLEGINQWCNSFLKPTNPKGFWLLKSVLALKMLRIYV